MSPVLAPIPPNEFKVILEKVGFRIERETEYNWTLFKADSPRSVVVLPKKGELVSVTVMMGILDQIKLDNKTYLDLLRQIQN